MDDKHRYAIKLPLATTQKDGDGNSQPMASEGKEA